MVGHTQGIHTAIRLPRPAPDDRLQRRVRDEYTEMPCLQLTVAQAMRLWSLDRRTCGSVLDALVDAGFLAVDSRGRYVRARDHY